MQLAANGKAMNETEDLPAILKANGYVGVRQLADGRWIGLQTYMFTTGLCIGLDRTGLSGRYCYEQALDAILAVQVWTGVGDPPGPWIKYKGRGGERLGPGATE